MRIAWAIAVMTSSVAIAACEAHQEDYVAPIHVDPAAAGRMSAVLGSASPSTTAPANAPSFEDAGSPAP